MAASKPTPKENIIQADGGGQWHKSVDLMDNICLCHRPITGGAEYAVVEHFPARGTNEIWNRGWNAVEVLKAVCTGATAGVADLDGGHDGAGEGISGGEISRPGHEPRGGQLHAPIHSRGFPAARPNRTNKITAAEFGFERVGAGAFSILLFYTICAFCSQKWTKRGKS